MTYTVGEMANRLGITASTLRYYDKEGLLPFVERSTGGIRHFTDEDYEWLQIIICLKKTGMQLKDIRTFVNMAIEGDSTIAPRLELINNQREVVKAQIKALEQTLKTLDYKKWFYETAQKYGTTKIPMELSPSEIPEEFQDVRKMLKGK